MNALLTLLTTSSHILDVRRRLNRDEHAYRYNSYFAMMKCKPRNSLKMANGFISG
jgi:hypothetical protein